MKKVFKANIIPQEAKFIPKIIWGIDEKGFVFILFKFKNIIDSKYPNDGFIIMYQDPKKFGEENVMNRMKVIIDYIKNNYECTDRFKFGSKNHFFIKKRIFDNYDKIKSFYNNLISNMIVDIANNISPRVINGTVKFADYTEMTGALNYYKGKT